MVVHNLTGWIWKRMSAHVAYSMKKGKSSKMTPCGSSNSEGDKLRLNLLKRPYFYGVGHWSSTQHIMAKLSIF
jgi:hypothetical protein